jgi:hypothetical protein
MNTVGSTAGGSGQAVSVRADADDGDDQPVLRLEQVRDPRGERARHTLTDGHALTVPSRYGGA